MSHYVPIYYTVDRKCFGHQLTLIDETLVVKDSHGEISSVPRTVEETPSEDNLLRTDR